MRISGMCGTHYSNILVVSSVILGCLGLLVDLAFLLKIACSYIVLCPWTANAYVYDFSEILSLCTE
jgi:hypothetical protein